MPIVACSPAITSKTEMPERNGSAVGAPVRLIRPDDRLDDEVVAGQHAARPPVPKPLIEA